MAAAISLNALLPNSPTFEYHECRLTTPCSLVHLCEKIIRREWVSEKAVFMGGNSRKCHLLTPILSAYLLQGFKTKLLMMEPVERTHSLRKASPVCHLSSRHVHSSSQTSQACGLAIGIPLRVYTVTFCSNVYSINGHLLAFIVLCYTHAFTSDPFFSMRFSPYDMHVCSFPKRQKSQGS